MSTKYRILVVGATGYIGGSILAELLASHEASHFSFSGLIRNPEQASKLHALNVNTILFNGLDDLARIREAASEHDIVINAASASHDTSAAALIEGLALRKEVTCKPVYMIHTSGTSILGDQPYSSTPKALKIWSDIGDEVYKMEKSHPQKYGQRVTDVTVVDTGLRLGVNTYIIVPPTICIDGKGSGPFATVSQQIPNLARFACRRGRAAVIECGEGIWNHVHISDLTRYYLLLLRAILSPTPPDWLPSGPRAILFAVGGEHKWKQASQGVADAMFKQGLLGSAEVDSISIKEGAEAITKGDTNLLEITLASNARARADFGTRYLNWQPKKGDEDFLLHFDEEISAIASELA